jgi:hypothetical protein
MISSDQNFNKAKLALGVVCSPMVGRFSGTLPTKIQILVLKPFLEIFQDLPVLCVKW